ncbi:MAG TPA: hypothetical protein VF791_17870 [Pyrinomonadaceae bacterium]
MNLQLWVAIIAASVTMMSAVFTLYFTRRREIKLRELSFKLDKYADFLTGFSVMGSRHKTYEAHLKLTDSVNTLNLIASSEVLTHVYELLDYVSQYQGASYSVEEQDRILNQIILSIRKDLGRSHGREFEGFKFRLISPGLAPGQVINE